MSGISWTDATWNPVVGCTRVSPGCLNCYASTLHNQRYRANVKAALAAERAHIGGDGIRELARLDNVTIATEARSLSADLPMPPQYDLPFAKVQLMPERLDQPLRWRKPRRIFVNSMSDLFHEDVPDEFIGAVFAIMGAASQHTFQVLTKRPERMRDFLSWDEAPINAGAVEEFVHQMGYKVSEPTIYSWPLPNVWLGVSVEDQQRADERIPLLLDTPAAVRFISAEPLLGPINLHGRGPENRDACIRCGEGPSARHDHEDGYRTRGLDWVIVGGESGKGYRPMNHQWVQSIRDQCRAAGVAYFGKQDSAYRNEVELPGDLGDRDWPK